MLWLYSNPRQASFQEVLIQPTSSNGPVWEYIGSRASVSGEVPRGEALHEPCIPEYITIEQPPNVRDISLPQTPFLNSPPEGSIGGWRIRKLKRCSQVTRTVGKWADASDDEDGRGILREDVLHCPKT